MLWQIFISSLFHGDLILCCVLAQLPPVILVSAGCAGIGGISQSISLFPFSVVLLLTSSLLNPSCLAGTVPGFAQVLLSTFRFFESKTHSGAIFVSDKVAQSAERKNR